MQTLFNKVSPISYGVIRYSEWNYIKAGLLRNLQLVQDYYAGRVYTVKSNHFLARLLTSINVPHSLVLERFYDNVDAKADNFSMAMKMTSSIYKGSIFTGIFYGTDNPEILISDNSSFNPFYVHKNWRTVSAVRPLLHPRSDLDLLLPNGRDTGSESGLSIIAINIPMLAVQYRAFCIDQLRRNGQGNMLTIGHFIHMHVLPNMLPYHIDLAIYNRLNNYTKGAPLGESKRKHPFAMVDYSHKVDEVQKMLVRDMKARKMTYESILKTIPTIVEETLEETLILPDIAPTRQVVWAEIMARIDAIDLVTRLGGKESISANRSTLNHLLRMFKSIETDRGLEAHLPFGMFLDIKFQIKEIEDRIN